MTPSQKSPEIENLLESIGGRTTAITGNKCVNSPIGCGKQITGFTDAISEKEYTITGLCQNCQDKVIES